jgi:hypothetical protein
MRKTLGQGGTRASGEEKRKSQAAFSKKIKGINRDNI